jgi:muramoyltetrapeptide carboxypeptidase
MQRRKFNKLFATSVLLSISKASFSNQLNTNLMSKSSKMKPLKKGDSVALIAPGSPVKEEKFINAIANMENLGLKPILGEFAKEKTGYLAGTDHQRLEDIHNAFANPEIKAIWCLRGGYGCTRLLPNLDYDLIRRNPKIFIGYSDITALNQAFLKKSGLVSFNGPVASSQVFTSYTFSSVKAMLFNEASTFKLNYIEQSDSKFKQQPYTIVGGKVNGRLIGGNLAMLTTLIGTKYAPTYKDKIVIIEDVGESPYRIDRMLTHMFQSSDLGRAQGIVFGVFSDCEMKPDDQSFTLKETLINAIKPYKIPSIYGFPFGHVSDISTFPIGIKATFNADLHTIEIENPF